MNTDHQGYILLGAVLAALCALLALGWKWSRLPPTAPTTDTDRAISVQRPIGFPGGRLLGRILLNDDTLLVTMGLLGGLSVTLKPEGVTVLASRLEARYLNAVVAELNRWGAPIIPGSKCFEALLHDFAQAVSQRLGESWTAFFISMPPQAKALAYLRHS